MKKVLSIISIFLLGLFLIACEKEQPIEKDPSEVKLEEAYGTLDAFIADASNVTNNFSVLATLKGGVSATWESSEAGIISFGAADATGSILATVNRPGLGEGNAKVTITATLSIKAANSDQVFTKVWTKELTVVESSVETIEVNNVADILAITDAAYDANLQVTIKDMTIIGKSAGEAFGYDGTGIIQLYGGASATLEVGKVYTVSGTIDWYFGIWEITKVTAVEQVGSLPKQAPKAEITKVSEKINQLVTAGEHLAASGAVKDGNFEPIYATVTGKVMYDTKTTGNYNTYIVDTDFDFANWAYGTAEKPAQGLLVYYNTSDFNLIREFAGLEVTMDVIIYTYRSNNQAFAIYYVGGPNGIEANVSDEQAVDIALAGITLPGNVAEATTLSFPTTGANNTTVAWSYKAENANNAYINLTTGEVTLPTSGQVQVKIVATVSKGDVTKTKEFTINVGTLQTLTIAQAYAVAKGDRLIIQGTILGLNGNNQVSIVDETGAMTIYQPSDTTALLALVGKVVKVEGEKDIFSGLQQIKNITYTEVKDASAYAPTPLDLNLVEVWNAESLESHQANLVSANGLVVSNFKIEDKTSGSTAYKLVTFVLTDAQGRTMNFRHDSRATLANREVLEALKDGDVLNFKSAMLAWNNGPQITINNVNQIEKADLTDAEIVALAKAELSLPTETKVSLTLPTELRGATIAWATNNAAVIAADGTFTAPAANTEVTLTATITKGEATQTVDFKVNALAATEAVSTTVTMTSPNTSANMVGDGSNEVASIPSLNANVFEVSTLKGSASSVVGLYADFRIYGDRASGNGNSLVVKVKEGYVITSVVINFGGSTNSATGLLTFGSNEGIVLAVADVLNTEKTYSDLNVNQFVLKNTHTGGSSNGQIRILSFEITYKQVA